MDTTVASTQVKPLPAVVLDLVTGANTQGVPKLDSTKTNFDGPSGAYAASALKRETKSVAGTPKGARNDAVNRASFSLGQLVGVGQLSRATTERELFSAAEANGLVRDDGATAVQATIRSGLQAGMDKPRRAEPMSGKSRPTRNGLPESWDTRSSGRRLTRIC